MTQIAEKLVPDTSIIIEGYISDKIRKNELKTKEVIIHEAVLAELEHQANMNKAIGYLGLEEIKNLRDMKKNVELRFEGMRPRAVEIQHASLGEIDAMVRQLAWEQDATLITSDKIQSKVAEAKGMKVIYVSPQKVSKKLKLEGFFDDSTMSVHLRQNVMPYAKKGFPGKWDFVPLRKEPLKEEEVQDISREIIEESKLRKDSFIEIERPGSTIVQMGRYRIVITKPPFSDGWEITAVKPVRTLTLDDYKLSEKLMKRLVEQAEGVLVAGSPGMGKSTFSQALAVFYADKDKIVKTVEAPRDLVLPEKITQYAISHGDAQEVHDVLLLSRPDYTFFDEMRNTDDFKLFADLRLAGVGMVGVVHATNPIDAIQRFIGRVEMGVIPQVIDTVVFIKNGFISKVLALHITVKVPSGMTEADLARPVVVVNDFETGKLEYEIYSYGEQTVVIPVEDAVEAKGVHKLAAESIRRAFLTYANDADVEMVSDHKCIVRIPERDIARVIGKEGKTISLIEKQLGIGIEIQALEDEKQSSGQKREIQFEMNRDKKGIMFDLGIKMQHKDVDIYVGNSLLLNAKVGSTGIITIKKNNPTGQRLLQAISSGEKIRILG